MQSPASATAVNGTVYRYYARSVDMSAAEIGDGAYSSSGQTFARTTVLANSLGTTAKINFGDPPQVHVYSADAANPVASRQAIYAAPFDAMASNNLAINGTMEV